MYDRLANILDISIGRHPVPRPSDGEVWIHPGLVYQSVEFVLTLAIALSASVAQLYWHQPRRIHSEELQTSNHGSSLLRPTFVHILCIPDIKQHHTLETLT